MQNIEIKVIGDEIKLSDRTSDEKSDIEKILTKWKQTIQNAKMLSSGKEHKNIKETGLSIVGLLKRIHQTDFSESKQVDDLNDYFTLPLGLGLTVLIYTSSKQDSTSISQSATTTSTEAAKPEFSKSLEIDCQGGVKKEGDSVCIEIGEIKNSKNLVNDAHKQLTLRLNALGMAAKFMFGEEIKLTKTGRCFYMSSDGLLPNNKCIIDEKNNITFEDIPF
jgi:hypothetical protein